MLPQVMWPVLAAMPAPTDNREDGDRRNLDFPGEQPSDKELNDWLDAVLPIIRQTYGAILNGDTPSHLIELTLGADDLTGYTRIRANSTEAGTMTAGQVAAHNRKICLLYTSPSPRDATLSRMPSSA